jgi:NTE family protein
MTDMADALVLGGGGIAWITGLLARMADGGVDVTAVDLIVGTSAGATVAAQIGSGKDLALLYTRQVDPSRQSTEISADIDMERFGTGLIGLTRGTSSASEMGRAVGRFALDASTVPEAARRATIEGHRYMDGGIRSNENADLAAGASRVLIIAPLGRAALVPTDEPLDPTVEALRSGGAVAVVPDEGSTAAFGTNRS